MDKLGVRCAEGEEEALVLTMDGPFEQKTGGKGANAAAAAGCTYACEFLGNFGESSAAENDALLADLAKYGAVATDRCATLAGLPTGTAYIMLCVCERTRTPDLRTLPPHSLPSLVLHV